MLPGGQGGMGRKGSSVLCLLLMSSIPFPRAEFYSPLLSQHTLIWRCLHLTL